VLIKDTIQNWVDHKDARQGAAQRADLGSPNIVLIAPSAASRLQPEPPKGISNKSAGTSFLAVGRNRDAPLLLDRVKQVHVNETV
jgi:hypothetical protein